MNNRFQISDDGSIFSISDDGTINRLGNIDRQGKIEGNSNNTLVGVLLFFLIATVTTAIVLGVNLSDTSSSLSFFKNKYYEHNT